MTVFDKIFGAPKADLHVHLEGTLEPQMIFKLAERNNIRLAYSSVEELSQSYQFEDLAAFLTIFWAGLQVVCTEQDFFDLTYDYLERAHSENTAYVEFHVSAQSHIERGVSLDSVMNGVLKAIDAASANLGIIAYPILCLQRHRTEEEGLALIEAALPYRDRIIAIGLGGPEKGNPPAKFARAYDRAREIGWRTTAHAGEEGPAAYVAEALDVLRVERIDHGVRSEADPDLVARLAADQVPLTVCPISNVRLKGIDRLEHHNLKRLYQCGCMVTVNTDDPGYFAANLSQNLSQSAEALNLSADDVHDLIANGFRGAFCNEESKEALLEQLRDYWRQN